MEGKGHGRLLNVEGLYDKHLLAYGRLTKGLLPSDTILKIVNHHMIGQISLTQERTYQAQFAISLACGDAKQNYFASS